jgi:hypothetical protein
MVMGELYRDFPIRDQDGETPQTLDLLQAWGRPGGGVVRDLVQRGFMTLRSWWLGR